MSGRTCRACGSLLCTRDERCPYCSTCGRRGHVSCTRTPPRSFELSNEVERLHRIIGNMARDVETAEAERDAARAEVEGLTLRLREYQRGEAEARGLRGWLL